MSKRAKKKSRSRKSARKSAKGRSGARATANRTTKATKTKSKSKTARTGKTSAKAAGSRSEARKTPTSRPGQKPASWQTIKVGIDLGNYRTFVLGSKNGDTLDLKRNSFPTVVGYLKLGAALDRLPGDVDALCGDDALKYYQQVNFKRPVQSGIVNDVKTCRQFAAHVCSSLDPAGRARLWGVVSAPGRADAEAQQRVQRSMQGLLERLVVAPEPYLVAEGMALDPGARSPGVLCDFASSCLVIDIGATTTSLCLVRGDWDTLESIELRKAGHWIDRRILANARLLCSGLSLTPTQAVTIKEEQAFVSSEPVRLNPSGSELIALTEVIRSACVDLLHDIVEASCALLDRCDPASAARFARNVIVTGGGSTIRGLARALEESLRSRGHDEVRVLIPGSYKPLVAQGARRLAEKLSDDEWEELAERRWRSLDLPSPPGVSDASPRFETRVRESVPSAPWNLEADRSPSDPLAEPEPGFLLEKEPGISELDELELFKALQPAK